MSETSWKHKRLDCVQCGKPLANLENGPPEFWIKSYNIEVTSWEGPAQNASSIEFRCCNCGKTYTLETEWPATVGQANS